MRKISNGVQASQLDGVTWQKSLYSNPKGNCVELAGLPGGDVAVRNSWFPDGPALVYRRTDVAAFLQAVKVGNFDVSA